VLGKNYSNGSIVSIDTGVVGVTAAYLPVVGVCTAQCREALCVCVCVCVYCTV